MEKSNSLLVIGRHWGRLTALELKTDEYADTKCSITHTVQRQQHLKMPHDPMHRAMPQKPNYLYTIPVRTAATNRKYVHFPDFQYHKNASLITERALRTELTESERPFACFAFHATKNSCSLWTMSSLCFSVCRVCCSVLLSHLPKVQSKALLSLLSCGGWSLQRQCRKVL